MCVCVCVSVLILIFRRALLSIPTCVNTPADQMADNDFQIDTLHSTSRKNQWALIAFFPRRSSLAWRLLSIFLFLCQFLCLSPSLFKLHSCTSQCQSDWISSSCFSHRIYCEKIQLNISLRRSGLCYSVFVTLPLLFVRVKVDMLSNVFLLSTDAFQIVINVFFSMLDRDGFPCSFSQSPPLLDARSASWCKWLNLCLVLFLDVALVVVGKMTGVDMNSDL